MKKLFVLIGLLFVGANLLAQPLTDEDGIGNDVIVDDPVSGISMSVYQISLDRTPLLDSVIDSTERAKSGMQQKQTSRRAETPKRTAPSTKALPSEKTRISATQLRGDKHSRKHL